MKLTNKILLTSALIVSLLGTTAIMQYANAATTTTTAVKSASSRSSASPQAAKTQIQAYEVKLGKQLSVSYENLFKINTLNKTQKEAFNKYTQSYKTSLNVTKETMRFYLEDITDIIESDDTQENKAKAAGDILARANNDIREINFITNDYLKNCAYALPTLTYQKFLKAFALNYKLDPIDMTRYTTMR